MRTITIKQGDEYEIPFGITLDGAAVEQEDLAAVEVTVGCHLRKTWPGAIDWDGEAGMWLLPLTQAETFAMSAGAELPVDVRVKTADGAVRGMQEAARLLVAPARSRTPL